MKCITIFSLVTLFVLTIPAVNSTENGIRGLKVFEAEAGPLTKRMESKHAPSPHEQPNVQEVDGNNRAAGIQGGDSQAREKCIEMLHRGDHEGAQNCIEQLQSGDSGGTQAPAAETQEVSQSSAPSDTPALGKVQGNSSGTQNELFEAKQKCAEMLRSGDHAGARKCIQQLRK